MSAFAFLDCRFELNSVVMSTFTRKMGLDIKVDELDTTAFGATYRSRIGGLKDVSMSPEFNQDFASGAVDATIFPILGTVVTAKIRPTSGAISATNPEYSGSVLISDHSPFGNSVGDLATEAVTWPGSGTWARATA